MTAPEPDTKPGKERIRASVVCVHRAQLLCVLLRDPWTREARLFVPGGAIEAGETPAIAASREALEETGFAVRVDPASERVARYPYEWNGQLMRVTTHFFRGSLIEPEAEPGRVDDASYHEGVIWLPIAEVPNALGFHSVICDAVQKLI
jgi:tRNA(adenine34) deaminase